MDFALSDDQQLLQRSAREFLEAEAPVERAARAALEDPTGHDDSLWRRIAGLGWTGVAQDEGFGGLGLGTLELALLLEEMGRVVLPSPFFSTVAYAAPVLQAAGADDTLRRIAAGETRATVATGDGVRIDGRSVSGAARHVPDAHVADEIVVVDRSGGGAKVAVLDAAACRVEQRRSLDPTRRVCDVAFDAAEAAVVLECDAATLDRAFDRTAVALAAEATGVATAVMERSVAYARERQQFGRAIGSFQAISHACAEMLVAVESARSTTYYAAWALDESAPDAALAASTAKACATSAATRVCESGIQVHGGIGFTWEHEMHVYYRRAKFAELFLGAPAVWRERTASLLVPA